MTTTLTVKCFVRYDPEVDVATLGFLESYRPGGPARQITKGSNLLGLVRLTADGSFDHLELLGASKAIPQFVSDLAAPASGVRDYHHGEFAVPVSIAGDRSYLIIKLGAVTESGEDMQVLDVPSADSTGLLARVRQLANGAVVDLTLFAVGPLIAPLIDRVSPKD